MIYLDTSALIKLYLLEKGSRAIDALIVDQDEPLPIWELQEAELHNAFRLKVFRKEMTEKQADSLAKEFKTYQRDGYYFMPDIDRAELMPTFHQFSRRTQTLGCRTLDILHVVCAHLIQADPFVSFDKRQCSLARAVGLRVLMP